MQLHYVYILECRDKTLYTGYTTDVFRRLKMHNSGRGAKYTRTRTPVVLKYCECYANKGNALRREREIKKYSRERKLKLIDE